MASLARATGVDASPQESPLFVARSLGLFLMVRPGIRLGNEVGDDRARTATARAAAAAGATSLVVGRVLAAADLPAAWTQRQNELA